MRSVMSRARWSRLLSGLIIVSLLATLTAPASKQAEAAGLYVGATAVVTGTLGVGLHLRTSPSSLATSLGKNYDGTVVAVIGGPISAEGYVWWQISTPIGSGWSAGDWLAAVTTVSARIDSHSASPTSVTVGQTVTFRVYFSNTGSAVWTFYAALSLRRPDGSIVHVTPLTPVQLSPGQQGSASWTYVMDQAGDWDAAYGIWKESAQINGLVLTAWFLDYVRVAAAATTVTARIDSHSPSATSVTVGQTVTFRVYFSNTGSAVWTFYAALSLRRPDGSIVHVTPLTPVQLSPGQQGSASWTYVMDQAGDWDAAYGIWKESAQINGLVLTAWFLDYVRVAAAATTISAHSASPSAGVQLDAWRVDPRKVARWGSVTLGLDFTNTGSTGKTFWAATVLRDPKGVRVESLPLRAVYLAPGEHGKANWQYRASQRGVWDVAFGVWGDSGKTDLLQTTGWVWGAFSVGEDTPTPVPILMNGDPLLCEAPAVVDGDVTMVPVRALAEALGADLVWDGQSDSLTVSLDGRSIRLQVGSTMAYVKGSGVFGQTIVLPKAPYLHSGVLMAPLRPLCDCLGASVAWETRPILGSGSPGPQLLAAPPTTPSRTGTITLSALSFPEGRGQAIPIYVPPARGGSNAVWDSPGWTTVFSERKTCSFFSASKALAGFEPPGLPEVVGGSVGKAVAVSFAIGVLQAFTGAVSSVDLTTVVQRSAEGKLRAILELGDPQKVHPSRVYAGTSALVDYGLMMLYFPAESFGLPTGRNYWQTRIFDAAHADDPSIGYISVNPGGQMVLTAKCYEGDRIIIWHWEGLAHVTDREFHMSTYLNGAEGEAVPADIQAKIREAFTDMTMGP